MTEHICIWKYPLKNDGDFRKQSNLFWLHFISYDLCAFSVRKLTFYSNGNNCCRAILIQDAIGMHGKNVVVAFQFIKEYFIHFKYYIRWNFYMVLLPSNPFSIQVKHPNVTAKLIWQVVSCQQFRDKNGIDSGISQYTCMLSSQLVKNLNPSEELVINYPLADMLTSYFHVI